MRIKDMAKAKELLIYYEDMKYPSLYGIIQEEPIILLNEDGDTVYYPESMEEMVEYDKGLMMAEDRVEKILITGVKP